MAKPGTVSNLWQQIEKLSPFGRDQDDDAPAAGKKAVIPASPAGGPPALLPPQTAENRGKLCVVLDMDETLIHSQFNSAVEYRQAEDRQNATSKHDFVVNIGPGEDGSDETANVYMRPGLQRFIERGSAMFEFVVFTAALSVYAKPVLDRIDPQKRFAYRLYREATVTYKGQPFVKDLSLLGRDMKRTIIIDNNPYAMLATPDNAMPILSYYDDPTDRELDKALALLQEMKNLDDVRPYLKKRFKFRQQLKDMMQWQD
jgi:RNA polymerase II subunit A small phosphatase-like protein